MRRLLIVIAVLTLPRVAAAQVPETIEYYAQDAIGSIRVVFTPTGAIVARQDYAPFGRPLFPAPAMPKEGFGGNEKDDESDQAYFHARMFQARTGRFTSPDPVGGSVFVPGTWNRYSFTLNSPLVFTDPYGEAEKEGGDKKPPMNCAQILLINPFDFLCNPPTIGFLFPGIHPPAPRSGGTGAGNGRGAGRGGSGSSTGSADSGITVTVSASETRVSDSATSTLIAGIVPNICGGGGFGYGAANIPLAPKVGLESIGLVEYDSKEGGSHGGVLGFELGPTVTGVESLRTWSDWQAHTGPIVIGGGEFSAAGKKFGKTIKPGTFDLGGFANWMGGELSLGAYVGGKVFGGGGYVSLSWSGCK